MAPTFVYCSLFLLLFSFSVLGRNVSDCSCGFYDYSRGHLFTESIIVYLNETPSVSPKEFVAENFEHKYEKDWNSIWRAAATPDNLSPSADGKASTLHIDPSNAKHVVLGSGIRTARRDIQYGSFCSLMRSPPRNYGGSSLSMSIEYNETQSIAVNLQNADLPTNAWVSTLINDEFPERNLGLNYSTIEAGSKANGTEVSPWNFTEYCINWTKERLDFYVAGNLTRSITKKGSIPQAPAPLKLRHWSTGNPYSMQGPPHKRSNAEIGWVRMFFNTTTRSKNELEQFNARCSTSNACVIGDMALRGSTDYTPASLAKWKQSMPLTNAKIAAIVLSVVSISFTALLLTHAFIRRAPWKSKPPKEPSGKSALTSTASSSRASPLPFDGRPTSPHDSLGNAKPALRWKDSEATLQGQPSNSALRGMPSGVTLRWDTQFAGVPSSQPQEPSKHAWREKITPLPNTLEVSDSYTESGEKNLTRPVLTPGVSLTATGATKPPPKQRIDYLAGLVALASLLVTIIHFGLTFVPALISPGAEVHYKSEVIAQKTISPLLLTFSWVGIFFTTSTRFLAARYLKDGELLGLAQKTVLRTPRLMIPVAAIVLLEYFLMNCGATNWLECLPSITWSTWPYTSLFPTFGDFLSELLELLYLIPNAAPQITFHYCTGVLWTIPVQLQGSWQIIMGLIVIREIKTPWKRFVYYLVVVVLNWYARNWGTFLWIGLIITDLDVTYNCKQWLYARPTVYYPSLLFFFLICALGFSPDIAAQWQTFNFSIEENNIHPDAVRNSRPIGQTQNAGYPAYYTPRFSAIVFVTGFQLLVEMSTILQKALSFPLLMKLFPHILTIYLVHGLIFWSLGSWVCVTLSSIGIPYWANLCVVAVSCYGALFFSLPFLTPVVELFGQYVTKQVWEFAHHGSSSRRRSLYPFPKDLFLNPENFKTKHEDGGLNRSDPEKAGYNTPNQSIQHHDRGRPRPSDHSGGQPLTKKALHAFDVEPKTWSQSNNVFQDEVASQMSVRSENNHFRKEMSQQRRSRVESIGSNNPFRDAFKEDLAELQKIRSREAMEGAESIGSNNPFRDSFIADLAELKKIRSKEAAEARIQKGLSKLGENTMPYPVPRTPSHFQSEISPQRAASGLSTSTRSSEQTTQQRANSGTSNPNSVRRIEIVRQMPQSLLGQSPRMSPQRIPLQGMPQRPADIHQHQNRIPRAAPRGTQFRVPIDRSESTLMRPDAGLQAQRRNQGFVQRPRETELALFPRNDAMRRREADPRNRI